MTTHRHAAKLMACLMSLAGVMAISANAATTTADAWSSSDPVGQVTVGLNGGEATVGFRVSNPPLPASLRLWADTTAANAAFAGDYKRAGVTALDFDLASSSSGSAITRVTLVSGSGRRWVNTATALGHNSVSFNRAAGGWILAAGAAEDENDSAWASDLGDVAGLGLEVIRNQREVAAHNVTVSGFQLTGSQTVGAADPTLADALQARFGVSSLADLDPAIANADDDGDGVSNLDEVLMEFDSEYFASKFKAELSSSGEGVVITFTCVNGKTYSVEKAASVDGAYSEVGSVTVGDTGRASVTDMDAGNGPNFYRVIELP